MASANGDPNKSKIKPIDYRSDVNPVQDIQYHRHRISMSAILHEYSVKSLRSFVPIVFSLFLCLEVNTARGKYILYLCLEVNIAIGPILVIGFICLGKVCCRSVVNTV